MSGKANEKDMSMGILISAIIHLILCPWIFTGMHKLLSDGWWWNAAFPSMLGLFIGTWMILAILLVNWIEDMGWCGEEYE